MQVIDPIPSRNHIMRQLVLFPCPSIPKKFLWWRWNADGHDYVMVGQRPNDNYSWYNQLLCRVCGHRTERMDCAER